MGAITCPRCGTENSEKAMNCIQCKINLKFALGHPEELERVNKPKTKKFVPRGRRHVKEDYTPMLAGFMVTLVIYVIFEIISILVLGETYMLFSVFNVLSIAFFVVPIVAVLGALGSGPGRKFAGAVNGALFGGILSMIFSIVFIVGLFLE